MGEAQVRDVFLITGGGLGQVKDEERQFLAHEKKIKFVATGYLTHLNSLLHQSR